MLDAVSRDGATGPPMRLLAVLIAAVTALALLPAAAFSQPERVDDPEDACPDEVNPPAPFLDRAEIPEVHALNVDCAYNNDITRGFDDATFRPRLDLQRDQFAAFLVRTMEAADVDLPEPSDQGFEDIEGNVHADDINILAETGITEGITATEYGPDRQLRRDQIATFVLRTAAYIEDVPLENLQREDGPFTDVEQDNVHGTNINGANAINLALGRTETEYFPAATTKRDQMASFLIRLLAALSSEEGLLPDELRATDLELTPQTSSDAAGFDHAVTALVTDDDGDAVEDVDVRLEVYRDDASTDQNTSTGPEFDAQSATDADGEVTFTYTGPQFDADDQLVACVLDPQRDTCQVVGDGEFEGDVESGARVHDTATKTWDDPVDDVVIGDDGSDVRAGDDLAVNELETDHTVSAVATDADGEPVADADLRFEVYRAVDADAYGGPVETSTVTTDADGTAGFTYQGPDFDAEDRIVICRPVRDDCLVTDEDAATDGTQFTGDDPQIGAEPNALAGKIWGDGADGDDGQPTDPTQAESASSQASGVEIAGELGDGLDSAFGDVFGDVPLLELVTQPGTPLVEANAPADGDPDRNADEVIGVPGEPLVDAGVIEVEAGAQLDPGEAFGHANVADVVVFPDAVDGEALVEAEAVTAHATATCPTPDEMDAQAALEAASDGTEVAGLEILGEQVEVEPGANVSLVVEELDAVVRVGIREVEHVGGDEEGHQVRGLVVELLDAVGEEPLAEIVVGEAHAAVDCTDEPATGESFFATDGTLR